MYLPGCIYLLTKSLKDLNFNSMLLIHCFSLCNRRKAACIPSFKCFYRFLVRTIKKYVGEIVFTDDVSCA